MAAPSTSAQGVELVNLVQLRVEEVPVGLSHAHHEGRVRHVRVNLLDDQAFGSLALVLVRSFRSHLVLPLPLTSEVVLVAAADVGHDAVDGFRNTVLARACACHEDIHQRGFVLHVVDVFKPYAMQVCAQRGEDGMRYGGFIDIGRAAHEELYQGGKALW